MAIKVCLIGCGGMAVNGHGPMLKKYASAHRGTELAACCDVSAERAESFASSFGFERAFTDMDEMLDAVKPDAAVLAVPVELTARLSVRILRRGIPLLTEKPPGCTVEEGRSIAAAAREAGVPASVAFNRRTMPVVQALAEEIRSVGKPIDDMLIEMCRTNRTEPDFSTTAIHDVDLARYLCGSDYKSLRFLYRVHEAAAPACDIHAIGGMESGAVVRLSFLPMSGVVTERVTVRLHGHTIRAELPIYGSMDAPGRVVRIEGNGVVKTVAGCAVEHPAEANGFLGEYESFLGALAAGRMPDHSVEASLQSLEVACCMGRRQESYAKG